MNFRPIIHVVFFSSVFHFRLSWPVVRFEHTFLVDDVNDGGAAQRHWHANDMNIAATRVHKILIFMLDASRRTQSSVVERMKERNCGGVLCD